MSDSNRKQFEDLVFNEYFMSTIENTGLGGCFTLMPNTTKTLFQAELCEREGEDYKRQDVSAMWFGWKKSLENNHEDEHIKVLEAALKKLYRSGIVVANSLKNDEYIPEFRYHNFENSLEETNKLFANIWKEKL